MPRTTQRRALAPVLAALLVLVVALGASATAPRTARAVTIACAPPASPPAAPAVTPSAPAERVAVAFPADGDFTVFAAASLTDSFTAIGQAIMTANPDISITFNFAGSPALVTQLTEGSPADVVALASPKQMANAVQAGVVAGTPVAFTQNRLAIVVPKDNPAGIQSMADLGKDGVKLVIAAADVPVGQYGRESVCNAGRDSGTYGEGFVDRVGANVVSEEDNVKAVLAKVQLGEADAGIVYTTDINAAVVNDVQTVEIPTAVNVIARYPIAAVAGGNAEFAAAFIASMLGPEGQAVLQSYGFESKPGA